jgi:hypothetical protein
VVAGNLRGGDADVRAGYVTSRVIGALVIALAIGLGIRWGVVMVDGLDDRSVDTVARGVFG